MPNNKFYSGTSGLVLTMPKRLFPPEFQSNTRLHYYATLFNSIEINSSFYKVPMAATVGKWTEQVLENFRFTFKLWKGITHNKNLDFNPQDVDQFMNVINHAGEKKGTLLVQLPPSNTISNISQLKKLLTSISKANKAFRWPVAVEFRNTSWYHDDLYSLLRKTNTSLVVHDHPSSVTPLIDLNTDVAYLRFHGTKGDYRGTYTNEHLKERAAQIDGWMKERKTVYTYFNNTIGEAVNNLVTLNGFINSDVFNRRG